MSGAGDFLGAVLHSETLAPVTIMGDAEGTLWLIPAGTPDELLLDRPVRGPLPEGGPHVGETSVHKKGGDYRVVGQASHVLTDEIFVVYGQPLEGLWARPRAMFEDGRFTRAAEPALEIPPLDWAGSGLAPDGRMQFVARGALGRTYRLQTEDDAETVCSVHLGEVRIDPSAPVAFQVGKDILNADYAG